MFLVSCVCVNFISLLIAWIMVEIRAMSPVSPPHSGILLHCQMNHPKNERKTTTITKMTTTKTPMMTEQCTQNHFVVQNLVLVYILYTMHCEWDSLSLVHTNRHSHKQCAYVIWHFQRNSVCVCPRFSVIVVSFSFAFSFSFYLCIKRIYTFICTQSLYIYRRRTTYAFLNPKLIHCA